MITPLQHKNEDRKVGLLEHMQDMRNPEEIIMRKCISSLPSFSISLIAKTKAN